MCTMALPHNNLSTLYYESLYTHMTSKFDEIKPFENSDLPLVLNNLANNQEFISTLVAFQFSKWPRFVKPSIGLLIQSLIKYKIKKIKSLRDFQRLVEPYMQRMIKTTSTSLTVSGLDSLDLSKPCLFVSNHRDIALDPAFVNWVLHINGQDTVRIAVGDNLLHTQWVADLIRLNKCFVVQRSVEGRREKLAAAKLLSEYMYHSLQTDKQHLWIAQREGRAKDGVDVTNPAILSMLTLNKPKDVDFGEYISQLRIVPVSISYEYDPCDVSKAKEMYQAESEGRYNKPDNEDMRSIVNGITGQKGQVHVHFGKLVGKEFNNSKDIAEYIDKEILAGYKIFPSTKEAARLLNDSNLEAETFSSNVPSQHKAAHDYLLSRLNLLTPAEKPKLLKMYANPLLRVNKQTNQPVL